MNPKSASRTFSLSEEVFNWTLSAAIFFGACYLLYSQITGPSPELYVEYRSCVRSLADIQNDTFPDRVSKVEHCRALVSDAPAISFWIEGTRHEYPAISR